MYCLIRSFDEKTYICDTCHKYLFRNEMPCRAVFNKKILYPILDEVELFKKGLEKMLIFKNIIFKKNRNNTWKREICENRRVEFIISPLKQQIYL